MHLTRTNHFTILLGIVVALSLCTLCSYAEASEAPVTTQTVKAAKAKTQKKTSLSKAAISVRSAVYNLGSPLKPAVRVTCKKKTLKLNKDYTVAYSKNRLAGTGTVTVKGRGAYKGTKSKSFKIKQKSIKGAKASAIPLQPFSGKERKPKITLKMGKWKLKSGRDYTTSYFNNVNAGTAKAVVTGTGNFKKKLSVTFKIGKADIGHATVADIPDVYTTSLKASKPKPDVTFKKKKLIKGTDYSLSYENNTLPGTGKVTIKGKGNFTGSTSASFKLINMGDDLAITACKLAYSRTTVCKKRYNWPNKKSGTTQYREAFEKYYNPAKSNPRDCGRGMATAVRHAGYDSDFPKTILDFCSKNGYVNTGTGKIRSAGAKKWKVVGALKNTTKRYWVSKATLNSFIEKNNIQPGDVFVHRDAANSSGHIYMYVGTEIPQQVYKSYLKGRGVIGGDVGEPNSAACFVDAHRNKYTALCIETISAAGAVNCEQGRYITVLRCVKPDCK